MPNLSFAIDTAKKYYFKLLEEFEDFSKDKISSRHAINCAMTAFHLTEWVYHEYGKGPAKKKDVITFQESLEVRCPELKVMHGITNGSKHYHLKLSIATGVHEGGLSNGFSSGFNTSYLYTEENNKKLDFERQLKIVLEFWRHYFVNDLNETL